MLGKLLLFVALCFVWVNVAQSRKPLRDFARGFRPFMSEERTLMRSEDAEEDHERPEYWRDARRNGMYEDGEGAMNERSDEDLPGEDEDVEELLSDDGEDPSTTESPATDESGNKLSSSSTEPTATEATTTVAASTESTTTTATTSSTAATSEPNTEPTVKPTDGLAEKVKEALKELTSSVAKQEKFCSFLTEKLQGRIYDTLDAEVREIEKAVIRGLAEVRVNRKRSTGSLLEGILGQLRDMRLKLRKHRY